MPKLRPAFITLIFICALTFLSAPVARAEDASTEKLKSIFGNMIELQKASLGLQKGSKLEVDGDITVEPQGDYYAVTLPHLAVAYENGNRFEIGIISVNAAPSDENGHWKMTYALPTPMSLLNEKGETLVRVNLGTQKAAGIWDETLEHFSKLDAEYRDISFESSEPGFSGQIASAKLLYNLDKDEQGLYAGPMNFSGAGIQFNFGPNGKKTQIGSAEGLFSVDRFDMQATKNYREELLKISQEAQEPATDQSAVLKRLQEAMSGALFKSFNGMTSDMHINNIQITDNKTGEETLSAQHLSFGFDLDGLMEDSAALAFRYGMRDFKNTGKDDFNGLSPSAAKLDWHLRNIPLPRIRELVGNTVDAAAAQPEMAQLAGLSLMIKVPALLAQSGTFMEIKDNFIAGEDYKVTLDGLARADISAVNSVTLDATATFDGLDNVITRTETLIENSDKDTDQQYLVKAKNLLKQLKFLKQIGKIKDGNDGAGASYIYRATMDEKGQILLNGEDMMKTLQNAKAQGTPAE